MTSTLTPARVPAIRVFGDAHSAPTATCTRCLRNDGSLWSLETSGLLRHWSDKGDQLEVRPLSDLETEWAFSSDVRVLASGSKELSLWDRRRDNPDVDPAGLLDYRVSLNVEPGFVATGHDDGSIRYWDLSSHSALKTLRTSRNADQCAGVSCRRQDARRRVRRLHDFVMGSSKPARPAGFVDRTHRSNSGSRWHPTRSTSSSPPDGIRPPGFGTLSGRADHFAQQSRESGDCRCRQLRREWLATADSGSNLSLGLRIVHLVEDSRGADGRSPFAGVFPQFQDAGRHR